MQETTLLEEKWKTQKKMAFKAGYNIKRILDNAEKTVDKMVEEYSLKLRYAKRKPHKLDLKR